MDDFKLLDMAAGGKTGDNGFRKSGTGANLRPGWLVRWLSPGDYHAIAISQSDGKARFYKRENDGTLTATGL